MDKAEFLKIAASLSLEERAAVLGARASSPTGQAPWKWQHLADALPDADIARVVNACRAVLRHSAEHPESAGADELAAVSPVLAAAARESAQHRGKPYEFSLASIATYLQSEAFYQRRAERARRVPVADPSKPFVWEPPPTSDLVHRTPPEPKQGHVTAPQGGGK